MKRLTAIATIASISIVLVAPLFQYEPLQQEKIDPSFLNPNKVMPFNDEVEYIHPVYEIPQRLKIYKV